MRPVIIGLAILIIAAIAILAVSRPWQEQPAEPDLAIDQQPPQPLEPKPQYVQTAEAFLAARAAGNGAEAHKLLTSTMKQSVTEQDYAAQIAEMKLSNPQVVAHADVEGAAYVIAHVQGEAPKGSPPFKGMQMLLKQEEKQWRVALAIPMEQVSQKYEDLKLAPGTQEKQWTITWQDEKGHIVTQTLPEL